MYKSPIELLVTNIYDQIQKDQDEHIYQAVLQYVPNVDREELIRALQYDRNQYEKGYWDGQADAKAELVRCKDCKFYDGQDELADIAGWTDGEPYCFCEEMMVYVPRKGFCHKGERKDNGTV